MVKIQTINLLYESIIIKSYFYSQNLYFIRTKFCLKKFTRIIQTIYLTSDKNNFQINLIAKILKIIQVKFCPNKSTIIIQ